MFKAAQKKSAPNSAQSSSLPSFLPESHTSLAGEVRSLASPQQDLGRLTRPLIVQPKLTISRPGDKYEREADRVAEQVMRMKGVAGISKSRKEERVQLKPLAATMTPLMQRQSEPEDETEEDEEEIQAKQLASQITPLVQRQAVSEEDIEEDVEEEEIQAKGIPGHSRTVTPPIAANVNALRGGGEPLPDSLRADFEPRFGQDFSEVRVHKDAQAAESAKAINAKAYTTGKDVVFGSGEYAPETTQGRKLLAHELTHVVQQSRLIPISVPNTLYRQPRPTKKTTQSESRGKVKYLKHNSFDENKLKEANVIRAKKLFLTTEVGKDLVTWLEKQSIIVNVKFVAKNSDFPAGSSDSDGFFEKIGDKEFNVYVLAGTEKIEFTKVSEGSLGLRSKTFIIDTDPSDIADFLFHELLHVWFVTLFSSGTGHTAKRKPTHIGIGGIKTYDEDQFDRRFLDKLKKFDAQLREVLQKEKAKSQKKQRVK